MSKMICCNINLIYRCDILGMNIFGKQSVHAASLATASLAHAASLATAPGIFKFNYESDLLCNLDIVVRQ